MLGNVILTLQLFSSKIKSNKYMPMIPPGRIAYSPVAAVVSAMDTSVFVLNSSLSKFTLTLNGNERAKSIYCNIRMRQVLW